MKVYPALKEFTVPHRTGLRLGIKLRPAYGARYASAQEAVEAWWSGKDWGITSVMYRGAYCSIRDSAALREEGRNNCVILAWDRNNPLAEAWVELVEPHIKVK